LEKKHDENMKILKEKDDEIMKLKKTIETLECRIKVKSVQSNSNPLILKKNHTISHSSKNFYPLL
jgi:hypothetical protein